jgi:hypothetical protein
MTTFILAKQRRLARQDIDSHAAQARQRYLTTLPGQDLVYAAKLAQAQAYITAYAADSGAAVPAYVAADVAAVGGTALAAAAAIVAAAEAFHAGPGPEIEEARRAGKLAVQAAESANDIETAQAAALAALQAI